MKLYIISTLILFLINLSAQAELDSNCTHKGTVFQVEAQPGNDTIFLNWIEPSILEQRCMDGWTSLNRITEYRNIGFLESCKVGDEISFLTENVDSDIGYAEIKSFTCKTPLPLVPVLINEVYVDKAKEHLIMEIEYADGCGKHEFGIANYGSSGSGYPAFKKIYLEHRSDDACEGEIRSKTLSFTLEELGIDPMSFDEINGHPQNFLFASAPNGQVQAIIQAGSVEKLLLYQPK